MCSTNYKKVRQTDLKPLTKEFKNWIWNPPKELKFKLQRLSQNGNGFTNILIEPYIQKLYTENQVLYYNTYTEKKRNSKKLDYVKSALEYIYNKSTRSF